MKLDHIRKLFPIGTKALLGSSVVVVIKGYNTMRDGMTLLRVVDARGNELTAHLDQLKDLDEAMDQLDREIDRLSYIKAQLEQ